MLSDGQLNLKVNKEYCVYGVVFRNDLPWYYLCQDESDYSPTAYPAELFLVSDNRLSTHWVLSVEFSSLLIKNWSNDPSFYERLVEGDPSAIKEFMYSKTLMDNE